MIQKLNVKVLCDMANKLVSDNDTMEKMLYLISIKVKF